MHRRSFVVFLLQVQSSWDVLKAHGCSSRVGWVSPPTNSALFSCIIVLIGHAVGLGYRSFSVPASAAETFLVWWRLLYPISRGVADLNASNYT